MRAWRISQSVKVIALIMVLFLGTQSAYAPILKPWRGEYTVNKAHQLGDFIAYWLFTEGSGNKVFDLSGNGNHGTLSADLSWVGGKYGAAIDFPGVTDYITAGRPPGLSDITYICHVKLDVIDTDQVFLRVAKTCLRFDNAAGGQLEWFPDIDLAAVAYNYAFVADVWYQLAVTQSGTNYALYINGILVDSGATNALDLVSAINVIIGAYNTTGTWDLNGQIDNVMVWNRALTASEIALLYREPFCMFDRRVGYLDGVAAAIEYRRRVIISSIQDYSLLSMFLFLSFIFVNRMVRKK